MKHEAIRPSQDDSDGARSRALTKRPLTPGLPVTDDEIAEADARAMADVEAGRVHSHELVGEWIATIASPDYKPFEEWLAARDG